MITLRIINVLQIVRGFISMNKNKGIFKEQVQQLSVEFPHACLYTRAWPCKISFWKTVTSLEGHEIYTN